MQLLLQSSNRCYVWAFVWRAVSKSLRLDRESGLRCTRSALSNQDSMSLKKHKKIRGET